MVEVVGAAVVGAAVVGAAVATGGVVLGAAVVVMVADVPGVAVVATLADVPGVAVVAWGTVSFDGAVLVLVPVIFCGTEVVTVVMIVDGAIDGVASVVVVSRLALADTVIGDEFSSSAPHPTITEPKIIMVDAKIALLPKTLIANILMISSQHQ